MAQTFDEIAEILKQMQLRNDLSTENIDKALSEISLKLSIATDSTEAADMARYYNSELKKIIDERFNSSEIKFENLKKQFEEVVSANAANAKTSELKDLFESFSINFSKILSESEQRRSILDNINEKINNISSETFYDSKLISEVSSISRDLLTMNEKIESIFSAVSLVIKNVDNSDKFEDIKSQLGQLSSDLSFKINSIASNLDFEQLGQKITQYKNNSDVNFENIVNEINNLKSEINANFSSKLDDSFFNAINSSIEELSENVELLRESSLKKYQDVIDNILSELRSISDETSEKLNSDSELNFGELKTVLNNIVTEFDVVKSEILKINDSNTFNISSGFSSINTNFENIIASISSLGENFSNVSKQNAQNIMGTITDLSTELEGLKEKLNDNILIGNIIDSVNSISIKIDELSEKSNFSDDIEKIKDALMVIKSEFEISKEEFSREIKENINIQSEQIKNISERVEGLKDYVGEISLGLKNYISELNAAKSLASSENSEKTIQKLFDIEASLIQNTQSFDAQFEDMQSKLTEFVHIVEAGNSDTEGKILSSLEEVAGIKKELLLINEELNELKGFNNEKLTETISLLDAGVENIVFNINNISDSIKEGVDLSVKENIFSIEEKFAELSEVLSVLKTDFSDYDNKLLDEFSEKFSLLKDEISLVNTDIASAIESKSDEILRTFEPLRTSLEVFADFNIEKLLSSFSSVLESSFLNFKDDFDNNLESNAEVFSNIKQTYSEILNKVSVVEEVVNKTLQNNIELLGISLESGLRNINSELDKKFENQIDDLKAYLDVLSNNTKSQDLIFEMKEQLFKTIENFKKEQESNSLKTDELIANISVLTDTIKSESKNIIDNVNNELKNSTNLLSVINSKVDILASVDIEENLSESITGLLDNIKDENKNIVNKCSNENVISLVEELKLDNTDIKGDLEVVNSKIENLAKTTNLLDILNNKVDILASDDFSENLMDEIDEIKNIIFEQRKYFEEASDEKSAAIDKYLRDVLVKLDNVDIEKSSEDIKEAVLSAVLSLSDQISFVEEAEEIKGFVEEKTDDINKNIIEVHKQLKQLTSGDDDFEYVYTLQDVESDIAKLRLAVNNISVGKFEDISDEIKKIVLSVENLESSLTQEQTIDLKNDIEKLNDDIVSISSRTNKLLLNSDESYKALNDGLSSFSDLIIKLEERINYLDNTDVTERLERKIDNIQSLSNSTVNSNKIINQAMIYLGEWVDSTTQDILEISDTVSSLPKIISQVDDIKNDIEQIRELIPSNAEVIDELHNKFECQEERNTEIIDELQSKSERQEELNAEVIDELEKKFKSQEERIDTLEKKLDKILSTLEEKDDMVLNRKVDKLEKMLSGLGASIEKLTSYVDEE